MNPIQKTGSVTRALIWLVMLCCWLVQAMAARHTLDADGISYQNMVDACLRGNWSGIVNGYWSPGYPFLLTLWFKLFHPSAYYVPLTIRFFGVVSLVFALLAFEYFMNVFFSFRAQIVGRDHEGDGFLSEDSIRITGYALFLWITVFLTPASLDHPDIWVFTCYLIASGLCMRLVGSPTPQLSPFLVLGMVLGCAYLFKAVMFPLSFTFWAGLLFYKTTRQSFWKLALGLAAFVAVASPFVTVLSMAKGRLTFGDAGAVNYQHVIEEYDEQPAPSGPTNGEFAGRLAAAPHISEYTSILSLGTYPPWADPSFGYRNLLRRFHLRRQLNLTHIVLKFYFGLFVVQLGCLLCGLLILLFYSRNLETAWRLFLRQIGLWLPAVTGFALYALVRAEGRFLGGFTLALFAACVAAIRFNDNIDSEKITRSVLAAVIILLCAQVLVNVGHEGVRLFSNDGYPDWQVAQALEKMGVKPGSRASYLGYTLSDHAWAYLAHVSIVAEIPHEDEKTFWAASPDQKDVVIKWLAKRGAKVLVTRGVPDSALSAGWKKVGDTDYYILELPIEGAEVI